MPKNYTLFGLHVHRWRLVRRMPGGVGGGRFNVDVV
jgi:hypothetical protein